MDLRKPDNLSGALLCAYNFMYDCQLHHTKMTLAIFEDTLNEYLFYMHEYYALYDDRFKQSEIQYPQINVGIEHIQNFSTILNGKHIPSKEKKLVTNFYDELLAHVDNTIGRKYYFGEGFSKEETDLMYKVKYNRKLTTRCDIKNIIVRIPRDLFEADKYIKFLEKATELSQKVFETDEYYEIEIDNLFDKSLFPSIYWIKMTCVEKPSLRIDYKESTDERLVIVFDKFFN